MHFVLINFNACITRFVEKALFIMISLSMCFIIVQYHDLSSLLRGDEFYCLCIHANGVVDVLSIT